MVISKSFLALTMLAMILYAKAEESFPCGYKYHAPGEGWFKLHYEGASWIVANRTCTLEGAELASPSSELMKDAMLSIMITDVPAESNNYNEFVGKIQVVHTAIKPKDDEELNFVEPSAHGLALTDAGFLKKVGQFDLLPYICYNKSPANINENECGLNSDYTRDNRTNKCYKFHRPRKNWVQAAIACSQEDAHLAIINSEVEAQVIRDVFARNPAHLIPGVSWRDSAFLGFRSYDQESWITIQEQSLSEAGYPNWSPGEPNNANGDEYCGSVGRNGLLFDDPCYRAMPFICEKTALTCRKQGRINEPISFKDMSDAIRNFIDGRSSVSSSYKTV